MISFFSLGVEVEALMAVRTAARFGVSVGAKRIWGVHVGAKPGLCVTVANTTCRDGRGEVAIPAPCVMNMSQPFKVHARQKTTRISARFI